MAQVLAEDGSATAGVVNELILSVRSAGQAAAAWNGSPISVRTIVFGRQITAGQTDMLTGRPLIAWPAILSLQPLSMGEQPPPQTKDNPSTFAVEFNQSALDVLPSCGRFSDEWHDVARKF